MSETTPERIVENHAKHIRQLTVEEVGTETLDALCRDAVQAAMLLGYRRANAPQPDSPSDEPESPSGGSRGAVGNDESNPWRKTADEQPPTNQHVEGKWASRITMTAWQRPGLWMARVSDEAYPHDATPPDEWRYIQPPTPAQPEGEKPPRDYRDDLLSCAKADAERLRNDARAISTRHREDLRAAEEFGDRMKTERDEAQFDLGNARGELMELHRILETIRRVADSKP